MFKYFNAHPQGKIVGDCVKRAITKATNIPYKEVSLQLNRFKKKYNADSFNDWKRNVEPFLLEQLKANKISFPAVKGEPRMNGNTFCSTYSKGTYVLQMANHLTCCKNGIIYDTWDCSNKCVYTAYKIS